MMRQHRHVILLVQPERDDRDMYVEFLRHVGLTPVPVSTAADALRVAPLADLIVTALLLPGAMDGIAFITKLKHDARMQRIPVIALTSCAWQMERQSALAAGCDLFLAKPCLPQMLTREIRRLLPPPAPQSSFAPHAA